MKIKKNLKVFLCFSWTGEDHSHVERRMLQIERTLKDAGVDVYVNLSDPVIDTFTKPGQYIEYALEKMQDRDVLMVVKSSEKRSEGQLMEIGGALYTKKRIITFLRKGLEDSTYIHDSHISDEVIVWVDDEDLIAKLKEML